MKIFNKTYRFFLIIICIAVLVDVFTGCTVLGSIVRNPRYVYENGSVLVGGDNKPIELVNSFQAGNVSYAELLKFISEDSTDQIQYIARGASGELTPFVCSDFAEMVHNNAEAAGIRAGYVSLDWVDGSIGHAMNVFETVDMGTVYIDCTGQSIYSQVDSGDGQGSLKSWDKVAYIEIGQKYGMIALDKADLPYYEYYKEYEQQWQDYKTKLAAYNTEVKQFNQEIKGQVYKAGSSELRKIELWESKLSLKQQELEVQGNEIGTSSFKPLGLVKSFSVHW
jgi:hypothetical protein